MDSEIEFASCLPLLGFVARIKVFVEEALCTRKRLVTVGSYDVTIKDGKLKILLRIVDL